VEDDEEDEPVDDQFIEDEEDDVDDMFDGALNEIVHIEEEEEEDVESEGEEDFEQIMMGGPGGIRYINDRRAAAQNFDIVNVNNNRPGAG